MPTLPTVRIQRRSHRLAAAGVGAVLLGAALAASPTPQAAAAAQTCDGQPATIVGSPDVVRLSGTDGDDVIVSNGSQYVSAAAGSDIVCMTGGDTVVDTGDADEVDQGLDASYDKVIGTGGDDVVTDGECEDGSCPAYVDSDDIFLGSGDSTLNMFAPDTGSVEGGSGHDTLTFASGYDYVNAVDIDNAGEKLTVTRGAFTKTTAGFGGFDSFNVDYVLGDVTMRGAGRDEELMVTYDGYPNSKGRFDVRMGGGDDRIALGLKRKGHVDGGSGRNLFDGYSSKASMDAGRVRLESLPDMKITSVRDLDLYVGESASSRISGDDASNRITLRGCPTRVSGGAGADRISLAGARARGDQCSARTTHVDGDRGNDVLIGSDGNDRLVGGPGRDRAQGGPGRDSCSAERKSGCEL